MPAGRYSVYFDWTIVFFFNAWSKDTLNEEDIPAGKVYNSDSHNTLESSRKFDRNANSLAPSQ